MEDLHKCMCQRHMLRWASAVAVALLLSMLAACKSSPSTRPTVIKITLSASATVNRDASGRPSPVAVRIYELKSTASLDSTDFFALQTMEQTILGADLNIRYDFMLRPGDVVQKEMTLQPATQYLAVVAAYREVERSRWRAAYVVPLHKKTAFTLRIDEREVTIVPH